MSSSEFFATCARGVEELAAAELRALGALEVTPGRGGVHFEGDRELLYRACLWLRTVTRVLMPLRDFSASTPEMLYDQVARMKWEQYLNPEKTFAVDGVISGQARGQARGQAQGEAVRGRERTAGTKTRRPAEPSGILPRLTHSHYVALKIKDSIVDRLRLKQGARPNVDTENPDLRISAYIHGGRCTLSLDASGGSLHERGYRGGHAEAPVKETLAAAILELTGWDAASPFIDPMCGSGTLAIEAGMKALRIAPGLARKRFGFMSWPDFDGALWRKIHDEALAVKQERLRFPIVGYDADRGAVAAAIENAKRAGVSRAVHFEKREISRLEPVGEKPGVLVVNPPYGERLGDVTELQGLYRLLGDLFKQRMKGWTGYIFTGNLELAKHVGLRASRRIELFNGPIECRLLKYEMY